MRLVSIDNPRKGQQLQCCICRRMRPVQEMQADLDGPAFQAYYCRACVAWVESNEIEGKE